MRISTRLMLLSLFYLTALGIVVGFDYFKTLNLLQTIRDYHDHTSSEMEISNMIQKSLLEMQVGYGNLTRAANSKQAQHLKDNLFLIAGDVDSNIDVLSNGGTAEYILRSNNQLMRSVEYESDLQEDEVRLEYLEIKAATMEIRKAADSLVETVEQKIAFTNSGNTRRAEVLGRRLQQAMLQAGPVFVRALERANEIYITAMEKQFQGTIGIEKESRSAGWVKLILAGIIGLTASLFGGLISHNLSSSLRKNVEKVSRIADGDLTIQMDTINSTKKDNSKDEVHLLITSLEVMRNKLQSVIEEALNSSKQGVTVAGRLHLIGDRTARITDQLAETSRTLRFQVDGQKNFSSETVLSLERIVTSLEDLKNAIENDAAMTEESSASIEEMLANIKSMERNGLRLKEQADKLYGAAATGKITQTNMSESMHRVQDLSDKLNTMNMYVADIASRINLLSMNAAIEAAHAGSYGKGFAVVASEIRKLSISTSEYSNSITATLKEVTQAVSRTADFSDQTTDAFSLIETAVADVETVAGETSLALSEQVAGAGEIFEAVSRLRHSAQTVSEATSNITSAVDQVNLNTTNLTDSVTTVESVVQDIQNAIEEIKESILNLKDLSNINNENADTIKKKMSVFRISALKDSEN